MEKHMINIAIYMRVSTKKQADSKLGLEAQERNIQNWLKYHYPYENYKTQISYFIDEGINGSKLNRQLTLSFSLILFINKILT